MEDNLKLLLEIDQELDSAEVKSLKFLCSDVIGRKPLETVIDAQVLFKRLSEQGKMDDMSFLEELLYTINRFDLLRRFKKSRQQVETAVQSNPHLSTYRKMLFDIAEDMTSEKLASMKFLVNLPRGKVEASATALDVLTEMEKQQMLTEDNVEELQQILEKCDITLASKVEEYKRTKSEVGKLGTGDDMQPAEPFYVVNLPPEPMEPQGGAEPQSIPKTPQDQGSCISREQGQRVVTDAAIVTNDVPEGDCYPMDRRPRGLCLIINNYKFDLPLKNREGTEQDAVSLRRVFKRLHFRVEEENDLTSYKMVAVVNRYARMDHTDYNAVVVCVLSHGQEGSVMGVDGDIVKIKDISKPFTLNRSLTGKPKIFFIQACQGKEFLRGHSIEEDGPQDQQDEDLEDDAYNPLFMKPSLAIEADILIGMSTVEEYKSFRYTSTGSIYIQALCRALESHCPKKEDLLTILTHVNREVSKGTFLTFKQMPQPKFTLRKKLVLTMD